MVSATLSDIVRRYKAPKFGSKEAVRTTFEDFPDKVSVEKIIFLLKNIIKKIYVPFWACFGSRLNHIRAVTKISSCQGSVSQKSH